jgi:hypothetical protein
MYVTWGMAIIHLLKFLCRYCVVGFTRNFQNECPLIFCKTYLVRTLLRQQWDIPLNKVEGG